MIRSGLANQQRGGGFEKGYPHQRDNTPRDEILRPYVDGFDTGMGKPSNFEVLVAKPVSYNQIFGKKTTPDERLYLLKMVQKGIKSSVAEMGKGLPKLSPPSLPRGKKLGEPPQEPYNPPMVPEGAEPDEVPLPDMIMEDEADLEEDLLDDELMAQDVVEPVIHQETFDEQMDADESWIDNTGWVNEPVVQSTNHKHTTEDDIDVILMENSFGGDVAISIVEPVLEVVPEISVSETAKEIRVNGIGPRRNTDSNRLRMIQQKARSEMFSQSRNVGPMREEISRWKTSGERMGEKEAKKKVADKKARQEAQMRGRDYGKLGAPTPTEMLGAPTVEKLEEPVNEKKIPRVGAAKKVAKKVSKGIRKSERVATSQKMVEINNLKLIISKLSKKEELLKKKGQKLSNNQFKVLMKAEKDLAKLLK